MNWIAQAVSRPDSICSPPAEEEEVAAAEAILGPLPTELKLLYRVTNGGSFGVEDGDPQMWTVRVWPVTDLAQIVPSKRRVYEAPTVFPFAATSSGEGFLAVDERGRVCEVLHDSRKTLTNSLEAFFRRFATEGLWWL